MGKIDVALKKHAKTEQKRKRDERGEKTKNKSANRLDKMPIFCSRASEMSSVERQNHRK